MKIALPRWVVPCLSLALITTAHCQLPSVYKDPKAPVEKRVEDLLSQMTPEEKIDMIAGPKYMDTRANPRLGIPAFKMTDGPMGARVYGPSTAYPAGMGLACTWDKDLAERMGVSMARDCRARACNILLAPGMNLYRAPMNGRNFEYLGEDPLLAGEMASSFITGVQGQGVMVTAKHFLANEEEINRNNISSEVDERTLRELYLKPFQIVVRNGALGVMTSYNLINGVHASQNGFLINTILKGEWGFKGLVMSDWGSCYDAAAMANGGLDLEMPNGRFFNRKNLLPLLASGKVTQAVINEDKVRRILRVAFTLGWFDRPQLDASIPKDDPTSAATALQGARESVTLLKNTGNLLPLDPAKVKKVVVLGHNADPAVTGGGGSSYTNPFHSVSTYQGIKNLLGADAEVTLVPWARPGGRNMMMDGNGVNGTPGVPPEYVEQVKSADVAVVCVGFAYGNNYKLDKTFREYEGEGNIRSYDLPAGQVEVIKAVLALNPRTVVVLDCGGSVATAGWIDQVPAFLDASYPGQEGGTAIAEILFGKTNPSGKLAFSWEKKWEDCAAYPNFPMDNQKSVAYKEGVFLGYRWFDAKNMDVLFPFGYGMSYTTFAYSGMKVSAPDAQGNITATATITNTGKLAGAEVAELYVQPPQGTVQRPVRELKGFTRVELQPGESRTATVTFSRDDLAYWDPSYKKWVLTPGAYGISLGSSSRQLLQGVNIKL